MNNDAGGLLVLVGIVLAIFTICFWSATTSMYKHDTFDCMNSCGGKHSIYNNNACYCKVGE